LLFHSRSLGLQSLRMGKCFSISSNLTSPFTHFPWNFLLGALGSRKGWGNREATRPGHEGKKKGDHCLSLGAWFCLLWAHDPIPLHLRKPALASPLQEGAGTVKTTEKKEGWKRKKAEEASTLRSCSMTGNTSHSSLTRRLKCIMTQTGWRKERNKSTRPTESSQFLLNPGYFLPLPSHIAVMCAEAFRRTTMESQISST
jgi:hypothetical protein